MLTILSLLFKLAGVAFLCIAAIGVMRLSDPFQRMHAATKAGTLGAGLVIIGAVIAHGALDATIMGILTVLFLLLTVPVAGHLLGRAAYVSGARLSLRGGDALKGILERSSRPLDERLGWLTEEEPRSFGATEQSARTKMRPSPQRRSVTTLPSLEAVRFAVIDRHVDEVATRACAIARNHKASLSAHVVIDSAAIECAEDQARMRQQIRERAGQAIQALKSCGAKEASEATLHYDEGDAELLLTSADAGETLLVLPCDGWFHHDVPQERARMTWEPDGLLRLPTVHKGPVLYASSQPLDTMAPTLVVRDRGEDHLPALLEWALLSNLWEASRLVHVVTGEAADQKSISDIAGAFGLDYQARSMKTDECTIPPDVATARAVLLGQTPRPLRTRWFGSHWRDRIAPGLRAEILVMEKQV